MHWQSDTGSPVCVYLLVVMVGGAPSSLDHALICKKGLIIQRHNELRDAIGDLVALVWRHVHHELIVQDSSNEHDALVADLDIHGMWQPQAETLFDIRVINTDA